LDSVDEHGVFFPPEPTHLIESGDHSLASSSAKKQSSVSWQKFKELLRIQPKAVEQEVYQTCSLLNYFLVHSKVENLSSVQVEWVNRDKVVLFTFSEFFLLNLKNGDLSPAKNHI